MRSRRSSLLWLLAILPMGVTADTAEDQAFFESRIRPVLIERCYECHGDKKQKGGLRLDSRPAWQAGGDSGAVIKPGDPESSLFIAAIRYADEDLQMPPKQRLDDREISLLTEWVRRGAPDTRVNAASAPAGKVSAMSLDQARAHWAFQPIRAPALPAGEATHPIDRFVRARLAAENLAPSPPPIPHARPARLRHPARPAAVVRARRTFAARRAPPPSPTLVDQLLARPEYGQRWGRHWLDVARYSDTTEKSTDGERRIPFAHTYRDYVIEAFNDRSSLQPFRPRTNRRRPSAPPAPTDLRALGFLTVGRRFEGNLEAPQLIIDDRIDTLGRGVLGLTLACARCHDHKFDAIPTADYYSLYGILASSSDPLDLPEVGTPGPPAPPRPPWHKYRAARAALFAEYEKHIDASVLAPAASCANWPRILPPSRLRVREPPHRRRVYPARHAARPAGARRRARVGPPDRPRAMPAANFRSSGYGPSCSRLPRAGLRARRGRVLAGAQRDAGPPRPEVLAAFAEQPLTTSMFDVADAFGRAITEALSHRRIPRRSPPSSTPRIRPSNSPAMSCRRICCASSPSTSHRRPSRQRSRRQNPRAPHHPRSHRARSIAPKSSP
jgi:hypothetical protein